MESLSLIEGSSFNILLHTIRAKNQETQKLAMPKNRSITIKRTFRSVFFDLILCPILVIFNSYPLLTQNNGPMRSPPSQPPFRRRYNYRLVTFQRLNYRGWVVGSRTPRLALRRAVRFPCVLEHPTHLSFCWSSSYIGQYKVFSLLI